MGNQAVKRQTIVRSSRRDAKKAAVIACALCLVLIIPATSCEITPCPSAPPKRFYPTLFRTGNSLEGYRDAKKQGVRFAESDFRLTSEGVLISTHDVKIGGNCGRVGQKTLEQLKACRMENNNHVATLADFLALPLKGWFLDLKDTESKNEATQKKVIDAAVEEIEKAGLKDKVVLMIYRAPVASVDSIRVKRVRAGMKGYPKSPEQTLSMVDKAFENSFEMICVHICNITPEIIDVSAKKGIWHLAWDLERNEKQWRELAQAGLGGVITRYPFIADKEASNRYIPPVHWTPKKSPTRGRVSPAK
jgi:hypothetical protein